MTDAVAVTVSNDIVGHAPRIFKNNVYNYIIILLHKEQWDCYWFLGVEREAQRTKRFTNTLYL